MPDQVLMILFILVIFIVTRIITTFLHELGHGITAVLLTGQKVSIYLGSYEESKNNFNFRIGLFDFWVTYYPFIWRKGLCVPSTDKLTLNKNIMITLAGPFTSFVLAVVACYFTFYHDLHGFLKLFFVIFLFSAIFDLLENLIPIGSPFMVSEGAMVYNDGQQLRLLFNLKRTPFEKAVALFNQQEYVKAAKSFKQMIEIGYVGEDVYRMAFWSDYWQGDYQAAVKSFNVFIKNCSLKADDYVYGAISHTYLEQFEKALELYDKAIDLDPNNFLSFANKGFTLTLMEKNAEAIPFFDKAIELESNSAYAFSNRGLAKIKIGHEKEGLDDIQHAFKLEENNPYNYRSLGIYHLDRGENSKAQELFDKAEEIDVPVHFTVQLAKE